jgi:hypothetical protein
MSIFLRVFIANETLYQLSYTPVDLRKRRNKSDNHRFVHLLCTCVETANVIFGHIDAARTPLENRRMISPRALRGHEH